MRAQGRVHLPQNLGSHDIHLLSFSHWLSLAVPLLFFWPHCGACEILVSPPRVKREPLVVKTQSPNHRTSKEFPLAALKSMTWLQELLAIPEFRAILLLYFNDNFFPFFFFFKLPILFRDFPGGSDSKGSACHLGDSGLIPGSGSSPGGACGNVTPVFLPGGFHGQRSLTTIHGVAKSQTWLFDFLRTTFLLSLLFKNYLYFCERIALNLFLVAVVLVPWLERDLIIFKDIF